MALILPQLKDITNFVYTPLVKVNQAKDMTKIIEAKIVMKEASDECCLKKNQTKLTKSNTKFLKSFLSPIDLLHK